MLLQSEILGYSVKGKVLFVEKYSLPECAIHAFCNLCIMDKYAKIRCTITSNAPSSGKMSPVYLTNSERTILKGLHIRALRIRDHGAPQAGMIGKIQEVDDYGQFHILWADGKNFTVLPSIDDFMIIYNQSS